VDDEKAERPDLCARHRTYAVIRLRLDSDPDVHVDLCSECFNRHAVMRADDEATLGMLRRAAHTFEGEVWRGGRTYYLLRGTAPAGQHGVSERSAHRSEFRPPGAKPVDR
jgi:hypothetical protein